MKEKLKIVTAFLLGAALFGSVGVYAASTDLIAKPVKFKVVVDGQEKTFDNQMVAINGTTYLSVRDTAKAVDKDVVFNNGVISLGSLTNSPTPVSAENNPSNTPKSDNNNDESSINNFKKLPLTVSRGNYSVTVTSISLSDHSTDIYLIVENNSPEKTTIEYGGATGVNHKVIGKKYDILGTIRTGDDFPNEIDANSTLEGIIRKSKVEYGTENIMFHLYVGREGFSFYIDTKGDL